MPRYMVMYAVELDAESPEAAAEWAMTTYRDHSITDVSLAVVDLDGGSTYDVLVHKGEEAA